MGIFRNFPYSNFHEMNMDEIIKIIKNMLEEWATYHAEWDQWMADLEASWTEYQDDVNAQWVAYQNTMNTAWQNMQNFINNYFDNLDVQEEINNKIVSMIQTGEFGHLVNEYIPSAVNAWLALHITQPTGVVIDTSLTVAGACADAKATGDAIKNLKSILSAETDNNIIAFKAINKSINGVQVTSPGNGIFSINGTAISTGGGTQPVTNTFHVTAGDYTIVADNIPTDFVIQIRNALTDVSIYSLQPEYPILNRTFEDGDYYIGFSVTNEQVYDFETAISLVQGTFNSLEFLPSIVANDVVARREIEKTNNAMILVDEKLSVLITNDSATFEQGTVSGNGALNPNPSRIRTEKLLPSNFSQIVVDVSHYMWVAQYDENGYFLRIDTTNRKKYMPTDLGEGVKYIRIVITNLNQTTPIEPTDETGFEIQYEFPNNMENMMDEKIDALYIPTNKHFSSFKDHAFILDSASAHSDATIVGNNYVAFDSGDDELTTAGSLTVYEFSNGFENSRTGIKNLYHMFGHCNSVDYSPVNDCLIMGNGSGAYDLPGKIYIIPNFSNIVENDTTHTIAENPLTLANTNAIEIDCTEYNLGTKFNVIWGELNNQRQDVAYLITAKYGSSTSAPDGGDNGTIRRILLGTGTNEFEYGSYIPASNGEFNGTFKILNTYTQDGTSYTQCNQGCCYHNTKIIAAIGHDGLWMWEMWLDSDGNHIWYDEYKQTEYGVDGEVIIHNSTSVCKDEDYIFFGQSDVGVLAIPI